MQYGPTLKTAAAEDYTMHIFNVSRKEKDSGRKGMPVCAWGEAGIGKTELPNNLVKKYADFFGGDSKKGIRGNIVYLPMAQIEEKAELQGLPDLVELVRDLEPGEDEKSVLGIVKEIEYNEYLVGEDNGIVLDSFGNPKYTIKKKKIVIDNRTIYATPSWIPQESTHGKYGLLVIDDMNRADARIINSIMQLLQDHRLLGWALPPGWEIYCTCNPDNSKYQVTSFDGAQMTRMCNFEQNFDVLSWVSDWAIPTGLHPLAQNYGLSYPESMVSGERTNPRSFDKFFRNAELYFTEPSDNLEKIKNIGLMNIDGDALASFITFITSGFGKLPNIEEILDGSCNLDELHKRLTQNGVVRVDIVNSLSCRLILFHKSNGNKFTKPQIENFRKWLKHPMLPGEIRYKSTKDSVIAQHEIGDLELSTLIMNRMSF